MAALFFRLIRVCALRSPRLTRAVFGAFARLSRRCSPARRRHVRGNLALLFPEKSAAELDRIGEDAAANFIGYLVDFFTWDRLSKDELSARVVWHGYEHIETLRAAGKPFMVMTAHLGNWEIAGAALGTKGFTVASLALPHGDRALNALWETQRRRYGMDVCDVSQVRHCFRAVKDGKVLALLGDRDFTGHGVDVDCGGLTARMPKGPAVLAALLKIPLVPGFVLREGDGFAAYIGEPLDMTDGAGEQEHLERCARVITDMIRRFPEQWFMFDPYFFPKK